MCRRFAITTAKFNWIGGTLATTLPEVRSCYNISVAEHPSHPLVRGTHELLEMRWGLAPHWAKPPKTPYSSINARAEPRVTSVAEEAALVTVAVTRAAILTRIQVLCGGNARLPAPVSPRELAEVALDLLSSEL